MIVKGYTLFDLDARINLDSIGAKGTYFQFNALNLFNRRYFGNLSTQVNAVNICPTGSTCGANANAPRFTAGSPRTIMGSVNLTF